MCSVLNKMFHKRRSNSNASQIQDGINELLLGLSPAVLLTLVVDDQQVYAACRRHNLLRQACIVAAVRKYHTEKLLYADVCNRTANYMVVLDKFLQIEDDIELKKKRKIFRFKHFKWFSNLPRNAAINQGDQGGGDAIAIPEPADEAVQ